MKLSERIVAIVNSIIIEEVEGAECRMELDRVGQSKAEKSSKEYKKELNDLLMKVDILENKKSHQQLC